MMNLEINFMLFISINLFYVSVILYIYTYYTQIIHTSIAHGEKKNPE